MSNDSFYCTNILNSPDDLNKIYFMDSGGNTYYTDLSPGRYNLPESVKSCKDQTLKSRSSMVSVSIPANGYAYFYDDNKSISPNLRLAGSYYTENTNSKSYSTGKYSGQTIIDYFNQPNFALDCACKITGTNAQMCGSIYDTRKIGCSNAKNDLPPSSLPPPRPFVPDIQRGYSSGFWWLIWILFLFIGLAVLLMILLNFGVFKSNNNQNPDIQSLKLSESIK